MSPSTYKTVEDISMIAPTNIASHQIGINVHMFQIKVIKQMSPIENMH